MEKLLEFLAWLVKALFGRDSESPAPETPRETPVEEAVTGWEGDPPYRYIDVSRYQGAIDWAQVAAAGYKGAMLKTVSTNHKLSKRADGLYIDEEFQLRRANYSAHCMPFTKESLFYREIFEKYYHDQSRTIVDFWMPNKAWPGCNVNDPSARVLANYGASGV